MTCIDKARKRERGALQKKSAPAVMTKWREREREREREKAYKRRAHQQY